MAYPKENTHAEYLSYLVRWSNGEEDGPKLSKDEWTKRRKREDEEDRAKPVSILTD